MMLLRPVKQRDSAGYVIVMMAISLLALVLLVGFAVDLGSWYLTASRLQRASDVAALSAASALPDTGGVQTIATETLKKNGVNVGGPISVDVSATNSTVDVTVKNSKVPTYFVSMVFPHITIKRSSQAQRQGMIPLGNPYNVFGAGNLNIPGVPQSGYWAAINGLCAPRADGDMFESMYDGNESASGHDCNAPASLANPSYRPGKFNGYTYMIDVPAGSPPVSIDAFDPQYASSAGIDEDLGYGKDDPNKVYMMTNFAVYSADPSGSEAADKLVSNHQFRDGESPGRGVWYTLYSEPKGASGIRHYRVKVNMTFDRDGRYGPHVNAYALMASAGGKRIGCDTRVDPNTCPKVYGLGAVSVYNDVPSGQSEFYLGEVSPTSGGTTFAAYMWDPGEGASSIEILSPNNTPIPFTWNTTPSTNMLLPASGTGPILNVSGTGAPQPKGGIKGDGPYNDRLVTMQFTVPANYAAYYTPGDYWWKLRYTSGASIRDRTTFGITSSTGTPPHLTK